MSKWIKNDSGVEKTWVQQTIANGAYYQIQAHEEGRWANNSDLLDAITADDAVVATTNAAGGHITDHNAAIDHLKDNVPKLVRSQSEAEGITFRLSRNSKATTSSDVTLEFKVPGTYGTDVGYKIDCLSLCFLSGDVGDYVSEINIIDKDNKNGLGANNIVAKWHCGNITSYQSGGAYLWPGVNNIQPMGDWQLLEPEMYVQIKASKAASDDTLYANILWGIA